MTKLKKLKLFDENDKEAIFYFNSEVYYVKDSFANYTCSKCIEKLSKEDFDNNNYELWTSRTRSYLKVDKNGELETLFKIEQITHKLCPKKKHYDEDEEIVSEPLTEREQLDPKVFLKDKEYWIEEEPNQWLLFVKYKGKIYKGSVSKKRAVMFGNDTDMKIVIVNLVLSNIQLQIMKEENIDKLVQAKRDLKEYYKKKLEEEF